MILDPTWVGIIKILSGAILNPMWVGVFGTLSGVILGCIISEFRDRYREKRADEKKAHQTEEGLKDEYRRIVSNIYYDVNWFKNTGDLGKISKIREKAIKHGEELKDFVIRHGGGKYIGWLISKDRPHIAKILAKIDRLTTKILSCGDPLEKEVQDLRVAVENLMSHWEKEAGQSAD